MNVIAENVARIREEMARAEARAGRPEGSVQLLAATKMNGADQVRAAIAAGVDACGENRVQELVEKNEQGAYTGAPLHFIGHLQKNKAKFLVGVADLIQSVDSPELMAVIDRLRAAHDLWSAQKLYVQTDKERREVRVRYTPADGYTEAEGDGESYLARLCLQDLRYIILVAEDGHESFMTPDWLLEQRQNEED